MPFEPEPDKRPLSHGSSSDISSCSMLLGIHATVWHAICVDVNFRGWFGPKRRYFKLHDSGASLMHYMSFLWRLNARVKGIDRGWAAALKFPLKDIWCNPSISLNEQLHAWSLVIVAAVKGSSAYLMPSAH